MPPVHQFTRAIRSGEYKSPKTVLGFFAGMIGIAATVLISAVWLLERTPSLRYLIPIALALFLMVFLFVLIIVVVITMKDPSKLMLGQISGRDYAEIQKVTLGDSSSGERVESVKVTHSRPSVVTIDADLVEETAIGESGIRQVRASNSTGEDKKND
jgi:hypothetical protein